MFSGIANSSSSAAIQSKRDDSCSSVFRSRCLQITLLVTGILALLLSHLYLTNLTQILSIVGGSVLTLSGMLSVAFTCFAKQDTHSAPVSPQTEPLQPYRTSQPAKPPVSESQSRVTSQTKATPARGSSPKEHSAPSSSSIAPQTNQMPSQPISVGSSSGVTSQPPASPTPLASVGSSPSVRRAIRRNKVKQKQPSNTPSSPTMPLQPPVLKNRFSPSNIKSENYYSTSAPTWDIHGSTLYKGQYFVFSGAHYRDGFDTKHVTVKLKNQSIQDLTQATKHLMRGFGDDNPFTVIASLQDSTVITFCLDEKNPIIAKQSLDALLKVLKNSFGFHEKTNDDPSAVYKWKEQDSSSTRVVMPPLPSPGIVERVGDFLFG